MPYDTLIDKYKALVVGPQTTPGTYEAPTTATGGILLEDIRVNMNPQRIESNENTGTPDQGETEVTHFEPEITGSFKLRGSGDVTVKPHGADLLESGGISIATKAVLPSSSTFAAQAGGTTSSCTVDRSAGNGSQLPSTSAGCADLVGRPAIVAGNPVDPVLTVIESCTLAGTNVTFVFAHVFGSALDASTTLLLPAGQQLDPLADLSATPVKSADVYQNGIRRKFKDCRTILSFAVDGAAHCIVSAAIKANFEGWDDTAVPTDMDLAGKPNAAKWRDGRARLAKIALAATSFELNPQTADARHRAPEESQGLADPTLTGRNVTARLVVNKVKKATQDRLAMILANTKFAVVLLLDKGAPVGTRFVLILPKGKATGITDENFQGILDDGLELQAVRESPLPTWRGFMF